MANNSGFMKDPRLRSKYQQFLASRGSAPYNPPGLDYNRGGQGVNAIRGNNTYKTAERRRFGAGDRLQQFLRNRNTEQPGMPRPATPASVQYAKPRRVF